MNRKDQFCRSLLFKKKQYLIIRMHNGHSSIVRIQQFTRLSDHSIPIEMMTTQSDLHGRFYSFNEVWIMDNTLNLGQIFLPWWYFHDVSYFLFQRFSYCISTTNRQEDQSIIRWREGRLLDRVTKSERHFQTNHDRSFLKWGRLFQVKESIRFSEKQTTKRWIKKSFLIIVVGQNWLNRFSHHHSKTSVRNQKCLLFERTTIISPLSKPFPSLNT